MLQDDLVKIVQESDIDSTEKDKILALITSEGASERVMSEVDHALGKLEEEAQKQYDEKLGELKEEYRTAAQKIVELKKNYEVELQEIVKEEETARKQAMQEIDTADLEDARAALK